MKAQTVADVILGEATSGTKEQRYRDMLAIASAIDNRAKASGLSHQDIVSNRKEFNAYGKALPPGASRYRELAKKALQDVVQNGPTHTGMFYSTPRAVGNLPKGLSKVASTTGHIFFEDPQGRPFNTALGYVEPVAIDQVQPRSVVDAITAPVKQVASTVTDAVSNIGSALRTAAFEPVSRPQVDVGPRGLEALAPNGLNPGGLDFYNSNQSGIAQDLQDALVGTSTEFGRNLGITSGYRSASHNQRVGGAKGSMHVQGKAADIDMTGMTSVEREQLVRELTQRGAGGFITYDQSPDMLHVDMRARPNGVDPHFMHNRSAANMSRAPDWFQAAADFGGLRTPDQAPVPDAAPRNPDPLVAAPLGQIERAPLAPVPSSSSLMAAPAGVVERGNLAAAQLREPDPERFGPRTATMTAKADRLPQASDPLASLISSASAAPMPNRPNPSMDTMLGKGTVTAPSFASQRMMAPATSLPAQRMAAPAQPAPQTSAAKQAQVYREYAASRPNPNQTLADIIDGTQTAGGIRAMTMGTPVPSAPGVSGGMNRVPRGTLAAPVAAPRPSVQPTNSMNSVPRGNPVPAAPNANMSLAAQYASYGAGRVPNPTPALDAVLSHAPSKLSQASLLPANSQVPTFVPNSQVLPNVPTQMIPAPVGAPRPQPLAQPVRDYFTSKPAAPPAPKFTASDIYGGQVGTGTATGGNSVSRFENNPNTYVTNAFGVTTATGPNGNQMAVKGTPGPLSKASLSDPLAGMLSKMPSGKVVAGTLLGAALGNAIAGPLAGAVGAKLGGKLASGNIAQNSLLSKLMGGYSTNILGQRMTFANPTSGGPFPNAPDRPSGSDRSYDVSRGRDISPGASREIESGGGGLY